MTATTRGDRKSVVAVLTIEYVEEGEEPEEGREHPRRPGWWWTVEIGGLRNRGYAPDYHSAVTLGGHALQSATVEPIERTG